MNYVDVVRHGPGGWTVAVYKTKHDGEQWFPGDLLFMTRGFETREEAVKAASEIMYVRFGVSGDGRGGEAGPAKEGRPTVQRPLL